MQLDLSEKLVKSLFKATSFHHHIPKNANLNKGEYFMLSHIGMLLQHKEHQVTVSDIQKMLQLSMPAVSQMLSTVERKGFIERSIDKNDRRKIIVSLTQSGETTLSDIKDSIDEVLNKAICQIGEEKCTQLYQLLDEFAGVIIEIRKG